MLQQISHLRFQQQNVPFSLMSGYTLALTKRFFKLQLEQNERNGAGLKVFLNFS